MLEIFEKQSKSFICEHVLHYYNFNNSEDEDLIEMQSFELFRAQSAQNSESKTYKNFIFSYCADMQLFEVYIILSDVHNKRLFISTKLELARWSDIVATLEKLALEKSFIDLEMLIYTYKDQEAEICNLLTGDQNFINNVPEEDFNLQSSQEQERQNLMINETFLE
jgi:hypothetical protein